MCTRDVRTMTVTDSDEELNEITYENGYWCYLPEAALLQVFSYLDHIELLNVGLVCRSWLPISRDDLLWRDLFYRDFKIDASLYPSK